MINKAAVKRILGELPLTAEAYWALRQGGRPLSKSFSLRFTEKHLPEWLEQAGQARRSAPAGRKLLIFTTLRYWIEHAVLMGMALAGQGHDVSLAYLPYANWRKPFNRFDLRRQNLYARSILSPAAPLVQAVSFLDVTPAASLPAALEQAIDEVSVRDVQYTLQVEDVDRAGALFRLRLERNRQAACAALAYLQAHRPDVLVTPNGSILEMGAVYAVARSLDIPTVTYEFGEQRGRIWLAQDGEVMRQETDALWAACQEETLSEAQWEQIRALFASRQKANLWENFSRRWQGSPVQGGERIRELLGLDGRPVALLAANVIGDSLTLGRQVFTHTMTEWLTQTVRYFAGQPQAQLVVRIHPGERYTKGPSVADVVRQALPELPEHIHLVEAGNDQVNTYDIAEIAGLGLVYTTTTGMEMALGGVPVIVSGQTHYRGKGFTLDPASWEDFFRQVQAVLADPAGARLSQAQVERAWHYYYRFFFDYPLPFPWHLLYYGDDVEAHPIAQALAPAGQAEYGAAFQALAGHPRQW